MILLKVTPPEGTLKGTLLAVCVAHSKTSTKQSQVIHLDTSLNQEISKTNPFICHILSNVDVFMNVTKPKPSREQCGL